MIIARWVSCWNGVETGGRLTNVEIAAATTDVAAATITRMHGVERKTVFIFP